MARGPDIGEAGPAIILIEPQLGVNIGMAARAMANFGLTRLRLVRPRDGWPSEEARAAASGADHIIDSALLFDSLEEACADLRRLYATSARRRDMIKPVLAPQALAERLRADQAQGIPSGILFGRERWGLHNDEVALCDALVTFPVNPAFPSLNIAQAVLLVGYEWIKSDARTPCPTSAITPASRGELTALLDHLEAALDEAGYFFPEEKRARMTLNLRGIFTHAQLSEQEVRTLRGVVSALQRKRSGGKAE